MRAKTNNGPSQRQLRVAEEIRHIIGQMLVQEEVYIPAIKSSLLMITEVRISPDLSNATVYVRGFGEVDIPAQVKLLNDHKGAFRYPLGKKMRLRIVPAIQFKEDDRQEQANLIADLLNSEVVRGDIEKVDEDL